MASFLRFLSPLLGSLFFISFFGCGRVDTPKVADPFANLTGKSLGFDIDPPYFEKDVFGRETGLDSAVPGACGAVLLQWAFAHDSVSSDYNISYVIYQTLSPGSENFSTPAYQVPASNTNHPQYLVKNLSPNTTYSFVVRARDEAGNLSVIDPAHLVEQSVTTQGTRDKGAGPNLYCPGGYAGDAVTLTGFLGSATTASFTGSLSLVPVPVTSISPSEVRAVIPSNIQSGAIQVSPGIAATSDRFLFFPSPQNISKDASGSTHPAIAVSGANVAMVWTDSYSGTFSGKGRILFSRSTDGGQTFSFSPRVISDMNRSSGFPSIAYGAGGNIYVIWDDIESAINNTDIYFSQSNDNGGTFSAPVNLSDNAGNSFSPKIAVSGSAVSVVWQDDSVLPGYGLTSVWGTTLNDVYAVGTGGNIYHSADQGNNWLKEFSQPTVSLNAIWGTTYIPSGTTVSKKVIYAAGAGGTILSYDGLGWSTTTVGSAALNGLWGSGFNDVYAVGAGGVILHSKDGITWTSQISPTAFALTAVWGSTANDVYAVGAGGTILHYDGLGWSSTSQTSGTTINLNAIWGSSSTDIYVAGDNGVILNSAGTGSWTPQPSGVTSGLNAIWGTTYIAPGTTVSTKLIYAGGANGKIIKKVDTSPWDATSVAVGGHFTIRALWGMILADSTRLVTNIYGVEGDGPVLQWTGANWRPFLMEPPQGEIFFRQSVNSGTSFSPPVLLSSAFVAGHQAATPDLVYSGGNLTVTWAETQSGIHLRQSSDGIIFSLPVFPLPSSSSVYPKLTQQGGNTVYLVWQDTSPLFSQIRMVQFPSMGLSTFPVSQLLTSSSGGAAEPAITVLGQNIVVVWADQSQRKNDNNIVQNEIFLISSPNGGSSFTPPVNFSSPFPDSSDRPMLVNDGFRIDMVWQQMTPPVGLLPLNNEIFFSQF
ncbi:MAG: hypothetical protein HY036_06220 [Nitrospirae bacterium]|nr:hypothetical protein [Nitrospirota bacterium]